MTPSRQATPSRVIARRRERLSRAPVLLVERHGVEFEAMIDQAIAEAAGDLGLQRLDLLGAELDHLAGGEVDEVVVMVAGGALVARAPAAELEAAR
jgi:hypothetical protein